MRNIGMPDIIKKEAGIASLAIKGLSLAAKPLKSGGLFTKALYLGSLSRIPKTFKKMPSISGTQKIKPLI